MFERPILEAPRLRLRPFERSDAGDITDLAGEYDVARTTLNIPHPYDLEAAQEWISTHEATFESRIGVQFAVVLRESGNLIGAISLKDTNWRHLRSELGYWIGKPYWRRGYCTEAASTVLDFAFKEWGMNRVQATVLPSNRASSRVLQKLGMQREGLLREYVQKNDVFMDLDQYAILKRDWMEREG